MARIRRRRRRARRRAAQPQQMQTRELPISQTRELTPRQVRRRGRGMGIRKDLRRAEALAQEFDLIPELQTLDTGRSEEVADLLAQRQERFDMAGQRSQEQLDALAQRNEAISMLEGGLGGLTSQENTLFRERGSEELDRAFQTGLRELAVRGGRTGVRGAAAQAGLIDIGRGRGRAQRGLERELQLENIRIQDERRQAFLDALSGRDEQLNLLEQREFARQSGALDALERGTQFARQDELLREQFNIAQQTAQDAARQSQLVGLLGLAGNRRAQEQAVSLQQSAIDAARSARPSNFAPPPIAMPEEEGVI